MGTLFYFCFGALLALAVCDIARRCARFMAMGARDVIRRDRPLRGAMVFASAALVLIATAIVATWALNVIGLLESGPLIWLQAVGLALLLPVSLIIFVIIDDRPSARLRRGRCPTCNYDLRGNDGAGCPECGWNRT